MSPSKAQAFVADRQSERLLMTSAGRARYTHWFKAQAAVPAATYKWGSPRQVLAVQLALVFLVGWLSTLVGPLVAVFGLKVWKVWVVGGAVGGILALVLKQFLKR